MSFLLSRCEYLLLPASPFNKLVLEKKTSPLNAIPGALFLAESGARCVTLFMMDASVRGNNGSLSLTADNFLSIRAFRACGAVVVLEGVCLATLYKIRCSFEVLIIPVKSVLFWYMNNSHPVLFGLCPPTESPPSPASAGPPEALHENKQNKTLSIFILTPHQIFLFGFLLILNLSLCHL